MPIMSLSSSPHTLRMHPRLAHMALHHLMVVLAVVYAILHAVFPVVCVLIFRRFPARFLVGWPPPMQTPDYATGIETVERRQYEVNEGGRND